MEEKKSVEKVKPELEKVVDFFERELAKIRVGMAHPAMVEDIPVDFLGEKLTLKELGTIYSPSRRQIVIQPWDKSCLKPIEEAISRSSLGINPVVREDKVWLSIPVLSGEQREELLRVLSDKKETVKRTIRRWRDQAWKEIQEGFKAGDISEDDKYREKKELEKLIEDYSEKLDNLEERKKNEIES